LQVFVNVTVDKKMFSKLLIQLPIKKLYLLKAKLAIALLAATGDKV